MSDNEIPYTVEKILRRELRGEETFYKIKWEGYAKATWEPEQNLDGCNELLSEFQKEIMSEILNVRQVDGRLEYLFKPKDNMPCTVVPAMVAIDQWPSLVFGFLESHVHVWKNQSAPAVTFEIKESEDTIGDPMRLTYVTDVNSELQYWFEWPQQKGKFVGKTEAVQQWPRLINDYFVAKLQWYPADNAAAKCFGHRIVTRAKSRMIISNGFDMVAKVKVERQVNYDKVLINKKSKTIARRRRTFTAVTPKKKSILKRKSMISMPTTSAAASPSTASAILARHTYTPPPSVPIPRATTSASGQGNSSGNTTSSPTASAILTRHTYTPPATPLQKGAPSTPQD